MSTPEERQALYQSELDSTHFALTSLLKYIKNTNSLSELPNLYDTLKKLVTYTDQDLIDNIEAVQLLFRNNYVDSDNQFYNALIVLVGIQPTNFWV